MNEAEIENREMGQGKRKFGPRGLAHKGLGILEESR